MTLTPFWLCLVLFGSNALASALAGPYQTLLYWFVYRMDIEAFGPLNQLIASGCRGSVGDGTCHFDEFVRHISPKFRGSTNIGQDLNPDVDNAVQQLRSRGYKPEVKAHILFPSVFVDDGQPPSLAKIVEEVGDTIKACRSKLGDGKLGQNLYKARYAMDITQEARQADQAAGKIREIKQKIIALGKTFNIIEKTTTLPLGTSFQEIDEGATLAACNNCDKSLHTAIVQFIADLHNKDNFARHESGIKAVQGQVSRLHRAPSC